ncbi:MAG: hypothetical protein P8Y18_02845 [Candidatus Bathyarchaeota archaeon]
MSGLFGTNASLGIDINLIFQVILILILVFAIVFKSKKEFKIHGELMGLALIFHILSFLIVMLPRFYTGFEYFTTSTSDMMVQIIWIHAVTGLIVIIFGIFIVGTWLIHPKNITTCFRKKRYMDIAATFWFISLLFGIITYMNFYS